MEKRLDFQGIRAIAIIVVLGFHFYPKYIPNGYLGVDIFFVLSGFLMCMLLKRSEQKESRCSLISIFYSKRFKRILPLYLLIIFFSIISLFFFFPDTAIETNKKSAQHALIFMSNRPKTQQEDYFQMLSIAEDIFTHTWSLSVEVQFYLIVPFLFLAANCFQPKFQNFLYFIIGGLSYFLFFISTPSDAFNSVFARIWQFIIGMLVFLLSVSKQNPIKESEISNGETYLKLMDELEVLDDLEEKENKFENGKNLKISYFVLLSMVFMLFWPSGLPDYVFRPLATISTGILMLTSENNSILSTSILTYIGDISYAVYIIHWPIYAYWKLTANGDTNLLLISLLSSVILSIIIHETFEKWYLKLSSTNIFILVVFLYILNVAAIKKDEISDFLFNTNRKFSLYYKIPDNMTIEDASLFNYRWNVNDDLNLIVKSCGEEVYQIAVGWCRHRDLPRNGTYKMAIFGNSWTANHGTLFYQECGYKAKSILQGVAPACEPLFATRNRPQCKGQLNDFEDNIRNEKPDYGFIFTRFVSTGDPMPKNARSLEEDPIYQEMKLQMMKYISNIKYKLFILDYLPRLHKDKMTKIIPMLKENTDPIQIDNILIDFEKYEMARKRHAQLIKDCGGKCVLVDYVSEFFNKTTGTFRYFDDRGFSYFTSSTHLTPHGLEHIRNIWTDICRKL